MQYDIFISYKRRGTSSATAAYLYDLLTKKGYSIFFDRKEIRQGSFDTQLLTHIENAKDIFVLLEDSSLEACFKELDKESYKTDWFCMEIMHALKKNKRIIPLLLDGYKMPDIKDLPDELKALSKQNAIQLDISEINDFYQKYLIDQKYLESKPRNIFLAEQTGDGVANFLFYCDEDCDIFEFGRLIGRIDQNIDEEHPYIYPVKFAGEHRFKLINNDTCEEQKISITIEKDKQLYVPLTWGFSQNLWELTDEIIEKQTDGQVLYLWGKGLFEGSSKHDPDYERSFKCLKRAAKKSSIDAKNFIINNCDYIHHQDQIPSIVLAWLETAANYECSTAYYLIGWRYFHGWFVERDEKKGIEFLEKAADAGNTDAINYLGYIYLNWRNGIETDTKKGLKFYEKAANAGNADAMNNLGIIYFNGKNGVEVDTKKGLEFYEKAANAGNVYAMHNLGIIYFHGKNGVEADTKKGLEFLKKAAEAGDTDAMNSLGAIFFHGQNGVKADTQKGLEYFEKAANAGDQTTSFKLGYDYFYGTNGIETDTKKGLEFLKRASDEVNVDAMYELGSIYFYGKNEVAPDAKKGLSLLNMAAMLNNINAMNVLGDIYFNGENGVVADTQKGLDYYEKAADAGNINAMNSLGAIFFHGQNGVKADTQKGLEYFEKAANAGNAYAMYNLGSIYFNGLNGVKKDVDKGFGFAKKAIDAGYTDTKYISKNFRLIPFIRGLSALVRHMLISKKNASL